MKFCTDYHSYKLLVIMLMFVGNCHHLLARDPKVITLHEKLALAVLPELLQAYPHLRPVAPVQNLNTRSPGIGTATKFSKQVWDGLYKVVGDEGMLVKLDDLIIPRERVLAAGERPESVTDKQGKPVYMLTLNRFQMISQGTIRVDFAYYCSGLDGAGGNVIVSDGPHGITVSEPKDVYAY
jgi:hypothetical protein